MNRYYTQFIQLIFVGLDLLVLNIIFLSVQFTYRESIFFENTYTYSNFLVLLNLCWLLFSFLGDVYTTKNIVSFELFCRRTSRIYFMWLLSTTLYFLFFKPYNVSTTYVFLLLVTFGVCLGINRFAYLGIKDFFKRRGYLSEHALIIGYNDVAKKLVSYLETENMNIQIIGYCEERSKIKELSNYPIISSINNVIEVSKQYNVNQIYSTISPEEDFRIAGLMKDADNLCIHFKLIPDLSQFIKTPFHISYINDMAVMNLRSEPLSNLLSRLKKRAFDIVFSLLILFFVMSWLFPIIALLIKFTSRGPVLYIQNRLGRNNKIFRMCKFRTMYVTESDSEFKQASKEDPRITKIGRFLRKTSLDEIPQFFNVLTGHMSVSGPRPHPLKLNDSYREIIEAYMARHFLKPGITGWAQVNGFRGETKNIEAMQERIKYDLWYMENWNLWLDVKIIFLTVYHLFNEEENAF